ncbi:MAG TPA: PA14 domain-containing protein [Planctomycetota bacterium]|nr:PA14 domain-containing protein [Planctomycetota bacterium]HRR79452.1 PA14 domain-containing protein [Planctomycetota bacterium]
MRVRPSIACVGLLAITVLLAFSAAHAGPYPGWDLRMIDTTGNIDNTTNALTLLSSPIGGPYGAWTATLDRTLGYTTPDWGTGGGYAFNQVYPSNVNSTDTFALRATADLIIPAGTWTVGFASDDGGHLVIPGITFTSVYNNTGVGGVGTDNVRFEAGRGIAWTGGTFTLGAPLATTIAVSQWENAGGDGLEIGMSPGTVTGTLGLLTDGVSGWSVTRYTAPMQFVNYRIQAGSASGNASVTSYLSSSPGVAGTVFAGPTAANPATQSGSIPMLENTLQYIHIDASGIVGAGAPPNSPWLEASFTAPPGWIFSQTGNQYLTTNAATWTMLSDPWGNIQSVNVAEYNVGAPSPSPSGHAPGAQAIWGWSEDDGTVLTRGYFQGEATLTQGVWTVFGTPVGSIQQPQGLSAHIVRVDNNLDNLGLVDTALTLRPGQANHSVSQVTSLGTAHLDTAGNYANPAGYLPGDQHSNSSPNPEDYAVRLAGYVYAPSAGYQRTFALSGDDRFYFKVGDVEFARTEAAVGNPPYLAQMTFPQAGYYPIELVWANRGGAGGLEISSAAGALYSWDSTTFQILGSDVNYPVYQRPSGVPAPSEAGANPSGLGVYTGAIQGAPDGFRVQQAYPTSHGGANPASADNSYTFFADKVVQNGVATNFNVGVVANRTNMDMVDPQGAFGGNWGTNTAYPIDNRDAAYNLVAAKPDDNFVTRINGLVYIDAPGTRAFTVGSDDGFHLRIGNQIIVRRPGSGATPGGTANYGYAYFPAAGLYPFEFYQYEGTGGSGVEIGRGGTTNLILSSTRNPADASNGFTVDWAPVAYSVTPVAQLQTYSTTLQAQAFGSAPGLVGDPTIQGAVNPEYWFLLRQTANSVPGAAGLPIMGLRGTYYDFANTQTVNNTWPPTDAPPIPELGRRNDLTTFGSVFNFAGGFASALVPSRPGSPTNPAGANDYFGVRWQGFINIPRTGNYSFQMQADDRAWMFIDLNGDLAFGPGESPAGQPVVWSNWMQWNNVFLTAGLHWVEFRSREWSGGETATFQWMMPEGGAFANIPAEYFINIQGWEVLAYGSGAVGDLANFADLMTFDFGSTQTLRLVTQIAGLTAYYEGTFTFVPEPGTLLLLAGGLLGAATRRRRNRR